MTNDQPIKIDKKEGREEGREEKKCIIAQLHQQQRSYQRQDSSNKEIDGSVEKPASFHPKVQPNRKCDDEKPLRDRSNL